LGIGFALKNYSIARATRQSANPAKVFPDGYADKISMLSGDVIPMNWLRPFIPTHFVAVVFAAFLVASGCDSRPPAPAASAQLHVFSTVFAMSDIARNVGGKYVQTEFAIESGQSLNDFQPSAAVRTRLNHADLVLADGAVDQWAVADSTNPLEANRVIRFDALVQRSDEIAGLLWLDPIVAQLACDELAKRLATIRPAHQIYFDSQSAQMKQRLDAVITEYRAKFDHAQGKRAMALSYEFDSLAKRFNVQVVHPLTATVDRLSEDQLRQLQRRSREEGITTLLVRSDTPRALVQSLVQRTGLRIVTLDAYGSSAATGRDSYESLLRYDLDQLLGAVNSAANGTVNGAASQSSGGQ
jgi:ABC-type Zn uptake system ZnuABC Zn-binding protein ZnuA